MLFIARDLLASGGQIIWFVSIQPVEKADVVPELFFYDYGVGDLDISLFVALCVV